MTRDQAAARAQSRWGQNADALRNSRTYRVGAWTQASGFATLGRGNSWHSAFENADTKILAAVTAHQHVRVHGCEKK